MRKIFTGILILVILLTFTSVSFAAGTDDTGRSMEKMHMTPMAPYGMPGMMKYAGPKSITGTPDGGVIILAGSMLLKYDSELNLVKSVIIEIPEELR